MAHAETHPSSTFARHQHTHTQEKDFVFVSTLPNSSPLLGIHFLASWSPGGRRHSSGRGPRSRSGLERSSHPLEGFRHALCRFLVDPPSFFVVVIHSLSSTFPTLSHPYQGSRFSFRVYLIFSPAATDVVHIDQGTRFQSWSIIQLRCFRIRCWMESIMRDGRRKGTCVLIFCKLWEKCGGSKRFRTHKRETDNKLEKQNPSEQYTNIFTLQVFQANARNYVHREKFLKQKLTSIGHLHVIHLSSRFAMCAVSTMSNMTTFLSRRIQHIWGKTAKARYKNEERRRTNIEFQVDSST